MRRAPRARFRRRRFARRLAAGSGWRAKLSSRAELDCAARRPRSSTTATAPFSRRSAMRETPPVTAIGRSRKCRARVARATLALEDRRFYAHPGVDPAPSLRAAWNNLARRGRARRRLDHRHAGRAHAGARRRAGSAQDHGSGDGASRSIAPLRPRRDARALSAPRALWRWQPRHRARGALLFRQAGRRSLLGRDRAARRHSAIAGAHEHRARERPAARRRRGRARARRTGARTGAHRARAGGAGAAQLAAMRPDRAAAPARALHLALRYEGCCAKAAIDAASPHRSAHPRDHRSRRCRREVAQLARRYLAAFAAPARGRSR